MAKYVRGVEIDEKMEANEVGTVETIQGTLVGIPYRIFCMKDPEYIMKMMSTYGGDHPLDGQPEVIRVVPVPGDDPPQTVKFMYPETVANHFKYRHMVDDHNNLCHALPSIEATWKTHRWANHVFSFLFAVSAINTYLSFRHFVWHNNPSTTHITLLELPDGSGWES